MVALPDRHEIAISVHRNRRVRLVVHNRRIDLELRADGREGHEPLTIDARAPIRVQVSLPNDHEVAIVIRRHGRVRDPIVFIGVGQKLRSHRVAAAVVTPGDNRKFADQSGILILPI